MKKMMRLMALLLSALVLFQSAAFAETSAVINTNAVTEEVYDGLVQAAATYAAADDGTSTLADPNTATEDEILETFNNTGGLSNVMLAVKRNGKIPGEPSVQATGDYYFFGSTFGFISNYVFSSSPKGIIETDIVDYQNFIFTSVDGSKTAGLVDSTGTTTSRVLSGIDFDAMLDTIASNSSRRPVTASDGTVVTTANKDNYRVICFIVKLQMSRNRGWHIDCVVVPKEAVTLSYNINIPDGYVYRESGVGIPNSESKVPPATYTVGNVDGLTTIDGQTKAINVINPANTKESYVFMFQGWNTKADGSGEWYQPDSSITIEEDTVLYAIWNSNPAFGTGNLEIQKIVSADPELTEADMTKEFKFQVDISNAEPADKEFEYVIYNADTVGVDGGKGTIRSGGTVTLKHSQYVEIKNIPAVNDDNGVANVTITELDYDGYTPSWEGGATTATIQGGRDSRVTCTNVAAPRNTTVTITKQVEGNMGDRNKEFPLTITVDGVVNETHTSFKHGSEITIEVPIGSTVIVTEEAGTYSPEVTVTNGTAAETKEEVSTATIESVEAAGATFAFVNTKNETVDTGILLDSLPYLLILALVAGGAVLWMANRRKRRED